MAVTIDESPEDVNLDACIKIDDVVVVNCTPHWIDQLTNVYTALDIANAEAAILSHITDMGYTVTPQLESDIKDAIAYVGTLG